MSKALRIAANTAARLLPPWSRRPANACDRRYCSRRNRSANNRAREHDRTMWRCCACKRAAVRAIASRRPIGVSAAGIASATAAFRIRRVAVLASERSARACARTVFSALSVSASRCSLATEAPDRSAALSGSRRAFFACSIPSARARTGAGVAPAPRPASPPTNKPWARDKAATACVIRGSVNCSPTVIPIEISLRFLAQCLEDHV